MARKKKDKQSKLGKKAEIRELHKKIKKLTFGVADGLTSIVLYGLYVSGYMLVEGGKGSTTVNQAFFKADRTLGKFNGKRLREALYNLSRRGFINFAKEKILLPHITEKGLARIKNELPVYDEKRVWDGKLYLINYDISISFNRQRDFLRNSLKDYKAVSLQDSLYLTPYNPREVVKSLMEEGNFKGQILVSTLDSHDAFGGKKDIKKLLWDVYGLSEVNQGYDNFIRSYKSLGEKDVKKRQVEIAFLYLSILDKDPQLPFELLPDVYLGDKAFLLLRKLLKQ